MTLVTRMAPASYYEPGLHVSLHFYDQSINVSFKQHIYMCVHVSLFLVFFPLLFLLVITPLHVAVLVSTYMYMYMSTVAVLYCNCTILCIVSYTCNLHFYT